MKPTETASTTPAREGRFTPVPVQTLALRIGKSKRVVGIASYAEASSLWDQYRASKGGFGASESPGATIIDVDSGKTVAHVSYNGRVWAGESRDWRDGTALLFDPSAK